ncbi:hypothetical protein NUU61_000811 [Penicillium alfredii]|uniref:Uncharacterized protein n=1 Tax=Penicillium alfredii TaxID=1506179 RepID=A0A9W9KR90_9EURO|nr:uncharacterized protein NUU61_000811 [Penicillium alfredii]KAJ5115052.1 hypothetical protein NUU61_000811 [Penicillium alfredii]
MPMLLPTPIPPVARADGVDQLPSGRRATSNPEPKRTEPKNPALRMVNIASPYETVSIQSALRYEPPGAQDTHFGAAEDMAWNAFIKFENFRTDKRLENLPGLFTLA